MPISDELAEQLITIPTTHVFHNPTTGGPITPQHLGKLVAAALPGRWTAHTLRHRFATSAYAAERVLRAVQELLGHVSPVTGGDHGGLHEGGRRFDAASSCGHSALRVTDDHRADGLARSRFCRATRVVSDLDRFRFCAKI